MSTPKLRLTRRNHRDLWTAVGVVLLVFLLLRAMPEDLESDLPQELVMALVGAGALVYVLARIGVPWLAEKRRRHRRHRRHDRA